MIKYGSFVRTLDHCTDDRHTMVIKKKKNTLLGSRYLKLNFHEKFNMECLTQLTTSSILRKHEKVKICQLG